MSRKTMKNAVALVAGALAIAGAVAIDAASPSQAAPAIPNTAAVKTTASTQVTDVYYRRGYYDAAITVAAIIAVAMLTPMGVRLPL